MDLGQDEADLPHLVSDRLDCSVEDIRSLRILRKSLDARRRDYIHLIYSVAVDLPDWTSEELPRAVTPMGDQSFQWPAPGSNPLKNRPVVVGSGPAGLFAAYMLAISGYQPIMLERGKAVKEREGPTMQSLTIFTEKVEQARFPMAN